MSTPSLSTRVPLSNGVLLPLLGVGTTHDGGFSRAAFAFAIRDAGLTLVDTARRYGCEHLIGAVIEETGVPRDELFITTKIWPADYGYESTLASLNDSLQQLGTSYVDLLLMHWPDCPSWCVDKKRTRADTWRALERAYRDGKCRSIGVSNFERRHLVEMLDFCEIKPQVNQIEFHPYCRPKKLVEFCRSNGIFVQGYGPLAKGEIIANPRLSAPIRAISEKHRKTVAQVVIRWCLQHGIGCIPKSTKVSRIEENCDVFDFSLDAEDMKVMDRLSDVYHCKSSWDPKALTLYQGIISREVNQLFQVEEIDDPG